MVHRGINQISTTIWHKAPGPLRVADRSAGAINAHRAWLDCAPGSSPTGYHPASPAHARTRLRVPCRPLEFSDGEPGSRCHWSLL